MISRLYSLSWYNEAGRSKSSGNRGHTHARHTHTTHTQACTRPAHCLMAPVFDMRSVCLQSGCLTLKPESSVTWLGEHTWVLFLPSFCSRLSYWWRAHVPFQFHLLSLVSKSSVVWEGWSQDSEPKICQRARGGNAQTPSSVSCCTR